MSTRAIELLHGCRVRLQGALDHLDIGRYRDDLSNECNVEKDVQLLKERDAKEVELSQKCIVVRDLPNKMEYSNAMKELEVTKNKAKALSILINHVIRNHDIVVNNKKRTNIEIDRLDDILLVAQLELSEYDETPSLQEEVRNYVPLQVVRERALETLQATLRSLEEVRETSQREKLEHRDFIYNLKTQIKSTRANIHSMETGTYAPALEFMSRLEENREAQAGELHNRRKAIEDAIEQTQTNTANDTLVNNANLSALQTEGTELNQKVLQMTKNNAASIHSIESALEEVKEEHSDISDVLKQLESRLIDEREEARLRQQGEEESLQRAKEREELEEKQWFAAFNIQLRWRAFLKRKAHSSKGKKKGKKGKKGKKKNVR